MNSSHLLFVIFLFAAQGVFAENDVEYYRDIVPLLQENCVVCHAETGVSFSCEDPETAHAFRYAIASAVEEDRMPLWLAEAGHQQYIDDYSLSPDEKKLIATWAAADYPRDAPKTLQRVTADIKSFDADLSLAVLPDGGYLPAQDRKDDYRCFVVDWPYEDNQYITGFKASLGNLRIAHHVVVHAIGPEAAEAIKAMSAEEDGAGHQCFGGALPDRLGDPKEREKLEERFPGG